MAFRSRISVRKARVLASGLLFLLVLLNRCSGAEMMELETNVATNPQLKKNDYLNRLSKRFSIVKKAEHQDSLPSPMTSRGSIKDNGELLFFEPREELFLWFLTS